MAMPKFTYHPVYPNQWSPKEIGETLEGEIFVTGTKIINKDIVPYVQVITEEGELIEVLMGSASLQVVYDTIVKKRAYYIGLRFKGVSTKVVKCGNGMKLYDAGLADKDGNELSLVSDDEAMKEAAMEIEEAVRSGSVIVEPSTEEGIDPETWAETKNQRKANKKR